MSLTPEQTAALAYRAGFRGDSLATAVAVAAAESGLNPAARLATSREDSRGLWQINTLAHPAFDKEKLYDPFYNAQAAFKVSAGGTNWRPWSVYKNGAYRAHLATATTAAKATSAAAGDDSLWDKAWDLATDPGAAYRAVADIGAPVIDPIAAAVTGAIGALPGVRELGELLSALMSGDLWKRLGLMAAGAALALVGVLLLTRDITVPAVATAVGGPGAGAAASAAVSAT